MKNRLQIFEEILQIAKNSFKKEKAKKMSAIIDVYSSTLKLSIFDLYSSSLKLHSYTKELFLFINNKPKRLEIEQGNLVRLVLGEIKNFSNLMIDINFHVIDVFYPGLGFTLNSAMGWEIDLIQIFLDHMGSEFDRTFQHTPEPLATLINHINWKTGFWIPGFDEYGYLSNYILWSNQQLFNDSSTLDTLITTLNSLEQFLARCNATLQEIVKENWKIEDLFNSTE